jgi:hypothetical protein
MGSLKISQNIFAKGAAVFHKGVLIQLTVGRAAPSPPKSYN